ncbi:hypothetical protein OC846_005656 [Tilletia horrida]|uniref:Uncharacterized protein n=1 Tax=Tilletia horrida TaxID=155126 RepID=A0AAN6JPQ1_9BASI|nr:hypothetical protein OC846_005656 [Tilletia horrida]KAK0562731.1 hypothetical protein OC861_005174 [Tilletia horrida]
MSAPAVFGPRDFFGTVDALFTFIATALTFGQMGKMIAFVVENTESGGFDYHRKRDLDLTGAQAFHVFEKRRGRHGGGGGGNGGGSSQAYAYEGWQQASLVLFAIGGLFGIIKFFSFFSSAAKIAKSTRSGNTTLAAKQSSQLFYSLLGYTLVWALLSIAGLVIDGVLVAKQKGEIAPYFNGYWDYYPLNVALVLFLILVFISTGFSTHSAFMSSRRVSSGTHIAADEKLNSDYTPSAAHVSNPYAEPNHLPSSQPAPQQAPPQAYHQPQAYNQAAYPSYPSPPPTQPSFPQPSTSPSPYPAQQAVQHNHDVKPSHQPFDGAYSPALLSGIGGSNQPPTSAPAGWTVSPSGGR